MDGGGLMKNSCEVEGDVREVDTGVTGPAGRREQHFSFIYLFEWGKGARGALLLMRRGCVK